jgi:hypothetical protein
MIPGSESCIKSVAWSLVFCVILLLPACSDDEPVEEPETEATTREAPLPVREWYPQQKLASPYSQGGQQQMMQPPEYSSPQPAQQQARGGGYQTYSAPQVIIVQPQPQWYGYSTGGEVPSQQMATPQQFIAPYNGQFPQRPWGGIPQYSQGNQQSYAAPATGNQQVTPWSGGWQSPGGAVYPGWGVPYGGYPGTAVPGYPW